jgi:hypothetical protein
MDQDQPSVAAPVLTFFRRHQKAIQGPNNSWRSDQPQVQLACLDARTGKMLHESEIKNTHEQAYGLIVDPVEGEVRVHTRLERVTFRYRPGEPSPDLIEGEDPSKPGDASQEIDEETREKLKAAEAAGGARIMIQAQAGRIQRIEKIQEIEKEKEARRKQRKRKSEEEKKKEERGKGSREARRERSQSGSGGRSGEVSPSRFGQLGRTRACRFHEFRRAVRRKPTGVLPRLLSLSLR